MYDANIQRQIETAQRLAQTTVWLEVKRLISEGSSLEAISNLCQSEVDRLRREHAEAATARGRAALEVADKTMHADAYGSDGSGLWTKPVAGRIGGGT